MPMSQANQSTEATQQPVVNDLMELSDRAFFVEAADVVFHMTQQIQTMFNQHAMLLRNINDGDGKIATALVQHSLYNTMETLGDLLSNMDAVEEDDEWTTRFFEELHRRCPKECR